MSLILCCSPAKLKLEETGNHDLLGRSRARLEIHRQSLLLDELDAPFDLVKALVEVDLTNLRVGLTHDPRRGKRMRSHDMNAATPGMR